MVHPEKPLGVLLLNGILLMKTMAILTQSNKLSDQTRDG